MEQIVKPLVVTYGELRGSCFNLPDDKYGIASYILTPSRIKALLECPFVQDDNTVAFYLVLVDDVIVGRETYFTSKMKIGDEVVDVESASAFEVDKNYRRLAVGADIVMATFTRSKLFIGAGVSPMALPLDRKLKFHILEFPRLMSVRNSRSILETKHLAFLASLINVPLHLYNNIIINKARRLSKRFQIQKVSIVPEWIDDIVLKDGHKYAEYHNHEWLQWNLDNNFRGDIHDTQSFYCVFIDNSPIGFYMLKERFRKVAGGKLKNVIIGSIVEWGTANETLLSEADAVLLSLLNFSPNVDIIEMATSDLKTVKTIKRHGFLSYGKANIVFKDRTKMYKDASDISLWRVRFGYGDLILT